MAVSRRYVPPFRSGPCNANPYGAASSRATGVPSTKNKTSLIPLGPRSSVTTAETWMLSPSVTQLRLVATSIAAGPSFTSTVTIAGGSDMNLLPTETAVVPGLNPVINPSADTCSTLGSATS